jgi:hypothetical protein
VSRLVSGFGLETPANIRTTDAIAAEEIPVLRDHLARQLDGRLLMTEDHFLQVVH